MPVGLGRRRVAAAYVSSGSILAVFFITISHCPWRDFISWSFGDKETKQRKRLSTICIKCPQRADHCFWFPRSTVLAKPRTLETLLLANPYIPTLRHQWSRARSVAHGPARPYAWTPRNQGIKESRNQGTKEPRNQGTKEPRNQGTKEPRNQGTKAPRHQGTKAPRHQGTRAPRTRHQEHGRPPRATREQPRLQSAPEITTHRIAS